MLLALQPAWLRGVHVAEGEFSTQAKVRYCTAQVLADGLSPAELCATVAEVMAQHERRGELVNDLLQALDAAKVRERQAAACHKALARCASWLLLREPLERGL